MKETNKRKKKIHTRTDIVIAGLDEILLPPGLDRLVRLFGHCGKSETSERKPLEEARIDIGLGASGGAFANDPGRVCQTPQSLLRRAWILRCKHQLQQWVVAARGRCWTMN